MNTTLFDKSFQAPVFEVLLSVPMERIKLDKCQKVAWRKLGQDEIMGIGDMWASHDPNLPERQGEYGYNLQMKAVQSDSWNKPVCKTGIGNGAFGGRLLW